MLDRLRDGLGDVLHNIVLYLPKLVIFILILLVGFLVARLLFGAVKGLLDRVRFPSLVKRLGPSDRNPLPNRWSPSEIIAKVVYYIVVLITLLFAFNVWGVNNPVSDLLRSIISWLPNAAVAVIILFIAFAIARAFRDLLENVLGGSGYGRLVSLGGYWFIAALGIIAALNQAGIAVVVTSSVLIAFLAALAGVVIVGVGGGLIKPMQSRWEKILDRGKEQVSVVAERVAERNEEKSKGRRKPKAKVVEEVKEERKEVKRKK